MDNGIESYINFMILQGNDNTNKMLGINKQM